MAFIPVLVAVLVGLFLGLVTGGRISSLRHVRVHAPVALVVAISSSLALDHYSFRIASIIAMAGMAAAAVLAVRNIQLVGIFVVGVGIVANLLPIAANGAVPVRADALVEAQIVMKSDLPLATLSGSRQFTDDSTILGGLGDTIPIRPTKQVVSYGDLILMVGLADLMANAMHRRRRSHRHARWNSKAPLTAQPVVITNARPVHDCGDAPSPRPESPFQYSAKPDDIAPRMIELATEFATRVSSASPLLDSPTQSR